MSIFLWPLGLIIAGLIVINVAELIKQKRNKPVKCTQHNWCFKFQDMHKYFECCHCGKRKVKRDPNSKRSFDIKWINEGKGRH